MGCGSNSSMEIIITEINENNLKKLGFNLKESLLLFFTKKISTNINIGIFSDIIYKKKKGFLKVIKYKNEKFFFKNHRKKINNSSLKKYYELYPQYIKYSSVGIDDKFSPNFLLNNNFEKIFESFGIKPDNSNENKKAISFINIKNINSNNLDILDKIRNKYPKSFYIYKNKNINDDIYIPYENWTIFFKGYDVDFWVENKYLAENNFDLFMNFKEKSINENCEIIENYTKNNEEKDKEYKLIYKYYELFDQDGTVISTKCFPLISISQEKENDNNNIINFYEEQKPKFTEYIINQINKYFDKENIAILKIEIFKERIMSFLLKTYFISKKKYSLYLSPINSENLSSLIKFIENNINTNSEYIYYNNFIENIIVMPELNTKFKFYEPDRFIYIIMNDSTCFNFAKSILKKKYKDIFGNIFLKFICIYINKNKYAESETSLNNNQLLLIKTNEEILFISEEELINKDNNLYEFYIHSFSDINYFSHILLITNSEGNITFINYFNNRAQIFDNLLKKDGINIKQGLDLINEDKFKEIKNFYSEKGKLLFNNINHINDENIIKFNDESLFENFYNNNIFYQPYLSLKYNKIITLNPFSNQKFYKNYTLNYMNIENMMEMDFDSKEHQCLNEISYIYNEKDIYIEFKKDLRCKNCYSKIKKNEGIEKNKYIFYICPISKDIICQKCYKNEKYEQSYPYNLLYINCKDPRLFKHLPKDNILLFKERINHDNHLEIIDEKCDICNNYLCSEDKKDTFYISIRVIKKNYFLVCKKCFELLINEDKEWIFEDKYNYINTFVINYFFDLENLFFKIVKFK